MVSVNLVALMDVFLVYLFLGSFGVSCVYQFLFNLAFLSYKKKTYAFKESISVIIAAHNEEQYLAQLFQKLLTQDYISDFEIIIALDRCTDTSKEIVEQFDDPRIKIIEIREVPIGVNPKKNALDSAIREASFEWLLLTDADCLPRSSSWISTMTSVIEPQRTEIVLGISPYFKKAGILNHFIQLETFYTLIQYLSFALLKLPYMGVGRNLLYKKELFINSNEIQKYKHVTGGDDDLFISRVANSKNTAISLNPNSWMYSYPKERLASYVHQKKRHLSVSNYYPFHIKMILAMLHGNHILFYLLVLLGLFHIPTVAFIFLSLKVIVNTITIQTISKKTRHKIHIASTFFFDFVYFLYLSSIGALGVLSKMSRWK